MHRVIRRADLLRHGHVDRLDAEFHAADVASAELDLAAAGAPTIGSVATILDERIPDPTKEGDSADLLRYLEISDIDTRDGFALAELIERGQAPSRARLHLDSG